MQDKDPNAYALYTYLWVILLSAWGGVVNWFQKRKAGEARPFNFVELIGELSTSAFAGLLTFYLCEAAAITGPARAVLVAISGHMGSRALYMIEKWVEAKVSRAAGTPLPTLPEIEPQADAGQPDEPSDNAAPAAPRSQPEPRS